MSQNEIGKDDEKKMSELKAYWHIHHSGEMIEFSSNIEERIKYIKENKPISEIETRLKWMTPVKGELPIEVVETWKVYDEAWNASYEASKAYEEAKKACEEAKKACYEASKAYDEAGKAYDEAGKAYVEAWKAYDEARKAYVEAWKAYDEARKAYDKVLAKHSAEIVDLHRIEHPNCPWDYVRMTLVFN